MTGKSARMTGKSARTTRKRARMLLLLSNPFLIPDREKILETNRNPKDFFGGAKEDRTPDLYNAIVALSQLSYGPLAAKYKRQKLVCHPLFYEIKQFLSAKRKYGMIIFEKTVNLEGLKEVARWFCQQLEPGDVVCLKGDLGAGKSEFARACIQTMAGQAVDVPSPTFTLCQTYDTLKGTVFHYDLYRLEKEEDVWELGIIEQIVGNFSFIEWPQIIEPAIKGCKRVFDVNLAIASEFERHTQIDQHLGPST